MAGDKARQFKYSAVIIALPYPSSQGWNSSYHDSSEDKLQEAYSEKIYELLHNLTEQRGYRNLIVNICIRDGRTSTLKGRLECLGVDLPAS